MAKFEEKLNFLTLQYRAQFPEQFPAHVQQYAPAHDSMCRVDLKCLDSTPTKKTRSL